MKKISGVVLLTIPLKHWQILLFITRNDLIQQRNGIKHVNIAPFMKDNLDF